MGKYLDFSGLEKYTELIKQHILETISSNAVSVEYNSDTQVLDIKIPTNITVETTKES